MKVFLAAALAFNVYQLTLGSEATNLVIANSTQAECVKNLHSSSSDANVIGPEFLSVYIALELNLDSNTSFNKEVSGCYFDSYVENVTVENLAEKLYFLLSTGSSSVTFFKDTKS
ncbi:MAG: hypothetical protein JXQ95_06305 [Alteromonas stellipolaris]|uniref:hypothetical protein n=1 Tax=Alteromonas stellipolaris TaxID=233316 RepID=UPI003B8C942A